MISHFGAPTVTKDGVSVAKEIELEDKFENMGAQMVKQVSSQTSDEAGDGTTTATVLAQSIVNEGHKSVAAGMNPMDLKRGIDKAIATAVTFVEKLSVNLVLMTILFRKLELFLQMVIKMLAELLLKQWKRLVKKV